MTTNNLPSFVRAFLLKSDDDFIILKLSLVVIMHSAIKASVSHCRIPNALNDVPG
jgi:hypothetical protein